MKIWIDLLKIDIIGDLKRADSVELQGKIYNEEGWIVDGNPFSTLWQTKLKLFLRSNQNNPLVIMMAKMQQTCF